MFFSSSSKPNKNIPCLLLEGEDSVLKSDNKDDSLFYVLTRSKGEKPVCYILGENQLQTIPCSDKISVVPTYSASKDGKSVLVGQGFVAVPSAINHKKNMKATCAYSSKYKPDMNFLDNFVYTPFRQINEVQAELIPKEIARDIGVDIQFID